MISRAAGLLLVALLPGWASAQTMTLTIPFRDPDPPLVVMQTAATVVEFDASTVPGTITVGGAPFTVAPSTCVGLACSTLGSAGGDDVKVTRIAGTNRVQVTVTYLSDFGANFCGFTAAAADRVLQFDIAGFVFANAGNGYRLTSFMAPSDLSCQVLYVRVPSEQPLFTADAGLTKLGRLPLNVVLVLDKSGSMGELVPLSTEVRWNRLKSSVEQFVKVWEVVGAPPIGTVESDGHADDRLGIVFFDSTTADATLDGVNFFKRRDILATPWWTPVEAALNSKSPGGSTTIGSGIARGLVKLDDVDSVLGDTAIVLFTDGEQNRATCVLQEGESIAFGCEPSGVATSTALVLSDVPATRLVARTPLGPVFTIGLGEQTGAFADLLDQISLQTSGQARIPRDGDDMDIAFVEALVGSLKGSTMSLLARAQDAMASGAPVSAPMEVLVDDSMRRVVFVAHLANGQRPSLEIRRPDNTVVQAPLQQTGNGLRIAAVDIPVNGPAGAWQVRIVRPPGADSPATTYHLSAYAAESKLSYRVTESTRTGTGEPVTVVAEIGWEGRGLAGLPPGAVKLRVERPGENLGNILFDSTATGDPGNNGGDAESALRAKLDALNAQGQLLDRIEPDPAGGTITMTDKGDGRYVATFNETTVGGQYQFRVDLDWTDPRTGRIRRFETPERQVPVIPTAAASEVATQTDSATGDVLVTVTPKDSFGNYVGPGYANFLSAQSSSGTVVLPARDPTVRGNYVIRVTGVPPGTDPNVKIVYRGQTLCDEPLSGCVTGGPTGQSKHAVWLGLGMTMPSGTLNTFTDGDFAANFGYEYSFNPQWSLEATLGLHQFAGSSGFPDVDITQFGVGGKWYFGGPTFRPFLTAGIGGYDIDPGSAEFGYNLGLGFQYGLSQNWSIEGRYTFHDVTGGSLGVEYSTLLFGVRYAY